MKKYIFMAVAGMLALSSCSSDDNDIQDAKNAPRQMTFTAGFGDGATTRATLQADKSVTFDVNDQISIYSANNTNVQFTTTAGGASATFDGTAIAGDPTYYAVYPYKDSYTFNNSTGVISGIEIPTSQWNDNWWNSEISYSGWDPKAPIAYATTTGSSLTFHNACAILKVTITGHGHIAIFTISANEPLAGTFSLDTSSGELTPTNGSTTVIVGDYYGAAYVDPNGGDKTVYVAIAPGTYTGFNLHIYNESLVQKSITKSGSFTFEAGKIYDLGSYDAGHLND